MKTPTLDLRAPAVQRVRVFSYMVPLLRPVRGTTVRSGAWIAVADGEGHEGWGDAAPWTTEFDVYDDVQRLLIARATVLVRGATARMIDAPDAPVARPLARASVDFAVSQAIADLAGAQRRVPLAQQIAADADHVVSVQALVATPEQAIAAVIHGHRALKMKIGTMPPTSAALQIDLLRALVGPDIALTVDANGSYSVGDAIALSGRLDRASVELFEQPCATIAEIIEVAEHSDLPIGADESIADEDDLRALAGHIHTVVLRPQHLGSLCRLVRLGQAAHAWGLAVRIGGALESAVGRAGALHLAAALHAERAGIDGLLTQDLDWPGRPGNGQVSLPREPGLGLRPADALLNSRWARLVLELSR